MEIFEKGTKFYYKQYNLEDGEEIYMVKKVNSSTDCNLVWYEFKNFKWRKKYCTNWLNCIECLYEHKLVILYHPCPKDIRPRILEMLNSGDPDTILLAEGILKELQL